MPKTNTHHLRAIHGFAPGSSRGPRSTVTFLAQMAQAMDAEDQAAVAARIKALRGRIPQPVIAERVGVSLRGYQEWESAKGSTPSWDNAKLLAEIHNVTPDYIYFGGDEDRAPAAREGDEIGALREEVSALRADVSRIVGLLERIVDDPTQRLEAELDASSRRTGKRASASGSGRGAQGGRRAAS